MKSILMIIGACMVILLLAAVITSINSFRMDPRTENHVITTGGAETTGTATLGEELFDDETYNVTAISSNVTGDAPIASSYSASTQVLTVSGLLADTSHMITLTYNIDGLAPYWGASVGSATWPLFLILGVIGIIAGAVYNATRGGD